MSEREKTLSKLSEWAGKTGRSINELLASVEKYRSMLQKITPGKDDAFYERRARFMVYRELKAQLRIPQAKQWEGIFFGYGSKMDVFARRRREALDLWKRDPQEAINRGLCNTDGTPIFTMPSGAVIKIDQPVMLRQTVGICRLASGGTMKLFVQVHRLEQCDILPPLGKPVRWTSRLVAEHPTRYDLTTVRMTSYTATKLPEYPTIDEATICDILMNAPVELKVPLNQLMQWHESHADDVRRICIVEGDVTIIRREPTSIGNYRMELEDETIMDLGGEGINVWIHEELMKHIDFGAGSRVYVIGRTVTGPGWDVEQRRISRDIRRVMINAFGIWPMPEFKIPMEEEFAATIEEVD